MLWYNVYPNSQWVAIVVMSTCDLHGNGKSTQPQCNFSTICNTIAAQTHLQLQLWLCGDVVDDTVKYIHKFNTISTILLIQCTIQFATGWHLLCVCNLVHDRHHILWIATKMCDLLLVCERWAQKWNPLWWWHLSLYFDTEFEHPGPKKRCQQRPSYIDFRLIFTTVSCYRLHCRRGPRFVRIFN